MDAPSDHEGEGKREASFDRYEVDLGHGFLIYLCLCGVLMCIPPLCNMHGLFRERTVRFPTRRGRSLGRTYPLSWWAGGA